MDKTDIDPWSDMQWTLHELSAHSWRDSMTQGLMIGHCSLNLRSTDSFLSRSLWICLVSCECEPAWFTVWYLTQLVRSSICRASNLVQFPSLNCNVLAQEAAGRLWSQWMWFWGGRTRGPCCNVLTCDLLSKILVLQPLREKATLSRANSVTSSFENAINKSSSDGDTYHTPFC